MELWLDTCHLDTIKAANRFGIIQGITTNPTLLAKAAEDPIKVTQSLLDVQDGPVAVQVNSEFENDIVAEAKALQELSDRIIVKIPVTQEGLAATYRLSEERIPVMSTALFHPNQAMLAALAGASYVAPYLGRMFDEGIDGWAALQSMLNIYKRYAFSTKIIVAAIKSTEHISQCLELGVHAMTIKKECFNELMTVHPLTQQWVKVFAQDWEEAKSRLTVQKTCRVHCGCS